MPVNTTKRGKCHMNRTPGGVKAKCTTKEKAAKQKRLINAAEHGFIPDKRKRK